MAEKICFVCNTIYYPNSNNSKYCSEECFKVVKNEKRRNKVRELKCPICNRVFRTSKKNKKYCSNNCYLTAKKIRKSKPEIEKVCRICSKNFVVKGKSRPAVYCSDECRSKRTRTRLVEKVCPNCKKIFVSDRRQTCCSRACSNEYTSKLITLECETCSNEFHVIPARLKQDVKPKFCSEPCYRESRRTGITPNCKCDNCGKERYKAPSLLKKHKYTFCSYQCMGEYYEKNKLFSGENSATYIGSIDKHGKYYGPDWHKQRRKARKRDNYTCQRCGKHENDYGMELSVHHIIPFVFFDDSSEENRLDNLISVCEPCHRKIHSGANHPTRFRETYKGLYLKLSN